jgi:cytochrome P450
VSQSKSTDGAAPGGLLRRTHTDIQRDGVTVKAGELVLLAPHEANVDTAAFERPAEFDIGRADNPRLTFGHGSRKCIGAPLVRSELQRVLATLVRRVPRLRMAVPLDALRSSS